jgi:membrane protease YdiL (CAAX protease family)
MDRDSDRSLVATRRHSAILCGVLLLIAVAGYAATFGMRSGGGGGGAGAQGASSAWAIYVPALILEWGLFLFVWTGLRSFGTSFPRLISARPLTARNWLTDAALGAILFAVMLGTEWILGRLLAGGPPAGVQAILVRRAGDIPIWVALSISAGFVEELAYRGYMQRQFGALLRSPWLGVGAQALLFGLTHGYQGPVAIARIVVLALVFGVAARLRGSLIPGMVAHSTMDIAGGLALFR